LYALGPLPWSDETLDAAVWKGFEEAMRSLDEHPGRDLADRSTSLLAVLRILQKAATSLHELLAQFHREAHGGRLFQRNRASDLAGYEERFQELLYLFASSAMTLADQSRALNGKVELPGYGSKVASFAESPRHRFVQELRNDLIHVTLHKPGWQLTSSRNQELTSKFMLWPHQLTRSNEYHSRAREYLLNHPKGIDLGVLVHEYTRDVTELQSWLQDALEKEAGSVIADYKRCVKRIRAVSARCWWNVLFQQLVLPAKRDPYEYLDRYLTPDELDEINSLPFKSKLQVDRIIQLVDEYGACDEALRALVYKAFQVRDA
jgi:hypothetical protein